MSPPQPGEPDKSPSPGELAMHLAYAEACIVLTECLMLVLVEKQLVSRNELLDAVENAMETKKAMADAHWHQNIAPVAAGVLAQIANSLRALP
jgi:hypothetical protein